VEGVVVKAALLGYPWSPPAPADGGAEGGSVEDAPVALALPPGDATPD
jgi:hypothetical protein